jgi:hypothetical protein
MNGLEREWGDEIGKERPRVVKEKVREIRKELPDKQMR